MSGQKEIIPVDPQKESLQTAEEKELAVMVGLANVVVNKSYLENLNGMQILQCPEEVKKTKLNDISRFFRLERFVTEKNENSRDKLISVFHAIASCGGSVLILINSNGRKIDYYFGTKTPDGQNPDILGNSIEALEKALKGNFPGTKVESVREGNEINELMDEVFLNTSFSKQEKQICTITGIAGLRSDEENSEKLFVQGMEKLIDSMQGEKYSLLLIADPVSARQIDQIRQGYENLYSELMPYSASDITYGTNESVSKTTGTSHSISKSITDTLTYTKGSFRSHTKGSSDTVGVNVGFHIGISKIASLGGGVNYSHTESRSDTTGTSESTSTGKSNTEGENDTESESDTIGRGTSKSIQLKSENKAIKNLIEKIDDQLRRLTESVDTGMWNCSVYCLADVASVCKIAASAYKSLLRGERSSIEAGVITEWTKENVAGILPYLEKMHHPVLRFDTERTITPTSFISGAELAIHAGFPQKSVSGLPVLEMASFGREVVVHWDSAKKQNGQKNIRLGKTYHMGNEEELPVNLDTKSLTSHTFITGSTGSGKSNTVYQLLSEIQNAGAHFLVIEPAKGEYKHIFGNNPEVSVYGTNPSLTPLLRINPFIFPNGSDNPSQNIHILEHLDRLVEIFNVCWPMYAAMPAVLKDAIEAAYEEAGWDLQTSTNRHTPEKYPSFMEVAGTIKTIIERSEYSDENKGNYKGSLITRLKSLTNGINGMIFSRDEISNEDLFDRNVIIDLSRVGSMETKALIMGLLVMKLQEYRTTSGKINSGLSHITVLEEAHNLLKRTSTEQAGEGANLLGKSVEMLANAIAEMRTYGEGFIIADQSPGLMYMSVIRNKNTKIILRLPDENDRILVGKSANLTDDQIVELARLQCGVAAVYQNDWIQPVLCKVREYKEADNGFRYNKPDTELIAKSNRLSKLRQLGLNGVKAEKLQEKIEAIDISELKTLKPHIVAGLFPNNKKIFQDAKEAVIKNGGMRSFHEYLVNHLEPKITSFPDVYSRFIVECIIKINCEGNTKLRELPERWSGYISSLGVKHA
jgi:hypothetical protein